ncbi:MAG TPA: asparagine synthase (glutamine-hydrolyzing) [Thermoanaerobaculia bacterium]
MCGIYGMVALSDKPLAHPWLLDAMGKSLRHRGPDGHGVAVGPRAAIGCERLRVVDLREQADQPFVDPGGGVRMACNGEIYNARDLRRRYRDYPYRSRSDVEVILPLYLDRGGEGLAELDGMFAVAIWDEGAGALILARDRAGEKPLFYCRAGGELWFASEVQTLLLHPGISREIDETAVSQYLSLGYVPEPRTGFRDVHKIEAGTYARLAAGRDEVTRYWWPERIAAADLEGAAAIRGLESLLRCAVRKQMIADVPVGVFVSGGVDSSLLAVLASREAGGEPMHTFVARFAEHSYDESDWAAICARRLGSRHHEVLVDERALGEALAAVTGALAEPLADPAILPTYLLAREARRHVTVVLSGEGADELFGGYPTYLGHRLAPRVAALPPWLRRLLVAGAGRLPASRRKVTLEFLVKRFLAAAEKPCLERHLAWFGVGASGLVMNGLPRQPLPPAAACDDVAGVMLFDYCTYLRDGLLVKNDRATMLNSLEARAPFLDRDLSAFALSLAERHKIRGLTTKWLLKEVAADWLPRAAVYRRKRGLSVPVAGWIDGALRAEVDRLLEPRRLARQELLDPGGVQALLAAHRSGKANHARPLWALIVLQYWLERWVPDRAGGGPEKRECAPTTP